MKFYMKLENHKGQKLIEPIFFFFEKFLFRGKCLEFPPKQGFSTFAKKLIHSCFFFFYPKMVTKRVLCDSPKSTCLEKSGSEMFSANHIAVFFDHQYLWKKSSDILVIFHGVGLQTKAASEKVVVV